MINLKEIERLEKMDEYLKTYSIKELNVIRKYIGGVKGLEYGNIKDSGDARTQILVETFGSTTYINWKRDK